MMRTQEEHRAAIERRIAAQREESPELYAEMDRERGITPPPAPVAPDQTGVRNPDVIATLESLGWEARSDAIDETIWLYRYADDSRSRYAVCLWIDGSRAPCFALQLPTSPGGWANSNLAIHLSDPTWAEALPYVIGAGLLTPTPAAGTVTIERGKWKVIAEAARDFAEYLREYVEDFGDRDYVAEVVGEADAIDAALGGSE